MKDKLKIEVALNNEVIDQMEKQNHRSEGDAVWWEHMFHSSAGCPLGELNIVQQKISIAALQENSLTSRRGVHAPGNQ